MADRLMLLPTTQAAGEIARLAEIAIFGNTIGNLSNLVTSGLPLPGRRTQAWSASECELPRGKGKTTGYYVPKGAQAATRQGVELAKNAATLRELAELNKDRNCRRAREAIHGEGMAGLGPGLLGSGVSAG